MHENFVLRLGKLSLPAWILPLKVGSFLLCRSHASKEFFTNSLNTWSHTKLPKIQQVIQHYSEEKLMEGKVINLEDYKKMMSLE